MSTTDTPAAKQTFEQKVNTAVDSMKQGDDGNWTLPEETELPEEVRYAATLEKRRRDTQASFSKSQQTQKQLEAENRQLSEEWYKNAADKMTTEQQEELDTLKVEDPEAWRVRLNEIEQANRAALDEQKQEIAKKAQNESEESFRERALAEFTEANPGVIIDDDVLANELPPKYLKRLENGDVTFSEFLEECKTYLTSSKVIKQEESAPESLSLNKAGGSSKPEESAISKEIVSTYADETY